MLVIFDCDGVLVDSEKLASEVFSAELAKHGIQKSASECFSMFKGHTLGSCTELLGKQGFTLPSHFIPDLKHSTESAFDAFLVETEGVRDVLSELVSIGASLCVASNGGQAKIQHSLKRTHLWHYFEGRCFSADSVPRGKPAPDLFLMAADVMGHSASEAVVIEDSEAGVTAAVAAGMRVLYFVADDLVQEHADRVSENTVVTKFTHMSQLLGLLMSDCDYHPKFSS